MSPAAGHQNVKFTIDDQQPSSNSRFVKKSVAILEKLKDGELKTTRTLAVLTGYSHKHTRDNSLTIPEEFTVMTAGKRLYGNPKTIAAWKANPPR